MDSSLLANKITDLIFNKKGYDVKIIDLRSVTTITDYFVICSGDSDTQVKAIADEIEKQMRDEGIKPWHTEGYQALSWVLIDFVDVVVHIFKKETREFYNLEKLWGDAPSIDVVDPLLKKEITALPKVKRTRKKV
ncbi:MAG: ribosome silencing factor [Ignavibacteriaceae bacterium]|nr:ribosome silencing factor [Ignavibacteriaceae bacterium]